MKNYKMISLTRINALVNLFLGISLILVIQVVDTHAQSSFSGTTPPGIATGSPTGSHPLSGFETLNPYSGNLNFSLPLLQVAGRGGTSIPIRLTVNTKWVEKQGVEDFGNGPQPFLYAENTWWNDWFVRDKGYGPGRLVGRRTGIGGGECYDGGWSYYNPSLTRLTFTTPDGTEHELVDQAHKGNLLDTGYCNPGPNGPSRGTVFITTDGTSATFTSDTIIYDNLFVNEEVRLWPSGFLMTKDGTRYRIDEGKISWLRDRNGNKLTFTYESGGDYARIIKITDSLNREITFEYDVQDTAPYGLCDRITYKGFGGAPKKIRISYKSLSDVLRSGYSILTGQQLFPNIYYTGYQPNSSSALLPDTPYNPADKVSAVWLPNDKSYQLRYNSYGELARVILPTGGAIEYDWADAIALGSGRVSGFDHIPDDDIYRRVVARRVYANGSTLEHRTTLGGPEWLTDMRGYVLENQYNASGTLLGRVKHYYYGIYERYALPVNTTMSSQFYPPWRDGQEYQTDIYHSNGSTVLKRIVNTWSQTSPSWYTGPADYAPTNNSKLIETTTTLVDTNQIAKQTFTYDQYNNLTDTYNYGYGVGAAGTLLQRTHTDYVTTNVVNGVTYNYATDTAIHLRSLPKQTSVYDSAGVEQARTTFEYDNYTATANHAALVAYSNISGLDSAFIASNRTRGNATAVVHYLLASGTVTSSISTYQQFDVAGNVVKAIDGRGNLTTLTYTDCFGSPDAEASLNSSPPELGIQQSYAFPGLVTNALGHTSYTQRDYYTGLVVDAEDSNGVTSSAYYNDTLDRLTKIIRAASDAALSSQTSFSYDDTARIVTTTNDLDAFNDPTPLKSQMLYDGLGRTVETRQYETATAYITTKQIYDALGRPSQVSNPYRTGQTPVWTTTTYDALSRVTSVTMPDNAVENISYSGTTATVTDQAGKDRQTTMDALGRRTQVIEDPGTGGLGYSTTYAYDVLGNLKTVTQGAQTRTFTYDSLSRLKSAANPESGTTSFSYDNNGNLTQKTDARSISTTFTYDALNRPTLKNYSDTTPDVAYFYDAQTLPTGAPSFVRGSSTGRLVGVTTGGTSAGSYYGYDGLGQSLRRIQQTDSINYLIDATYNRAGAMTSETYPLVPGHTGRRTVNYSFDIAGRLSSLTTAATTYAAGASVTAISYAAHGGLSSETLGNNLVHALSYNNRLQPTQIKLGTAAAPTSILNLSYNYGTTANNGNVLDVTNTVGAWTTKQIHTYDALNRLDSTSETNGSTTTYWTEDEAYDRYGNRWEVINGTPSATFNLQNKIVGYTYDLSGNMTNDTTGIVYTYDAENRIKTVAGVANTYVYDGEGKRIKKYFPQGEQVRFVYGVAGQLIMEFSTATAALKKEYIYGAGGLLATIEPTIGTRYATADHLGSPRVVTSSVGAVVSRRDFKPFGRELFVGDGGRTALHFYSVDEGLRQKFAGKERDNETGLDYFGARYYASTQGRFSSSDPILIAKQKLLDPQQWNMYSYTRNNPIRFTDPTGEYVCTDKDRCEKFEKARQGALKSKDAEAVRAANAYGELSTKQGDKGDNGVYVSFAEDVGGDRRGTVSRRDTGIEPDPNSPNGMRAAVNVTIQNSEAGNEEVIAHEGSHIADRQEFVNAIGKDGNMDKAKALNITLRESEIRAYKLSISYAQRGNLTLNFGRCGLMEQCKFPPAMMPNMRDQRINDLLNTQYRNLDTVLFPELR